MRVLIGVVGVFDDPDNEELQEEFPFVAQMDGLLLWDNERSLVMLTNTDMLASGTLEESLVCVARSADELLRP